MVPGKIDGTVTPEEHNRGDASQDSPYTSWTFDRSIAESHADDFGPGGVVLMLAYTDPEQGDTWHWEDSPDNFGEEEVLLHGYRTGARVEVL